MRKDLEEYIDTHPDCVGDLRLMFEVELLFEDAQDLTGSWSGPIDEDAFGIYGHMVGQPPDIAPMYP